MRLITQLRRMHPDAWCEGLRVYLRSGTPGVVREVRRNTVVIDMLIPRTGEPRAGMHFVVLRKDDVASYPPDFCVEVQESTPTA